MNPESISTIIAEFIPPLANFLKLYLIPILAISAGLIGLNLLITYIIRWIAPDYKVGGMTQAEEYRQDQEKKRYYDSL